MTDSNANTSGLYLLMKRGLYYRPDAMGYTGIKDHAGRYSKDDAEDHADPASGVTMVSEAEAPEFSPNCFDDLARAHLLKQRDAAEARADRLDEGLRRAAVDLAEARDMLKGWGAYVDPHFQDKHDLEGDIGRLTIAHIEARNLQQEG